MRRRLRTAGQRAKVAKTMREYSAGALRSGSKDGPVVKDKAQALAIGYAQALKTGGRRVSNKPLSLRRAASRR